MKKVFVTGSAGMVGSRFVELYKDKYELIIPEIDELELTHSKKVEKFVKTVKPEAIIHFAAFTDVSASEKQRSDKKGSCWMVNVEATRNLAKSVDPQKTHIVHISTDMVFSGQKDDPGPYEENHKTEKDLEKLTWYGYTKKLAEDSLKELIRQNYSILRLIYPVRTGYDKKLDPQIMGRLKMFDEGKLYPLFDDQYLSISDVDEACIAVEKIIEKRTFGIFHASSKDTTTPYELGSYLLEKARNKKNIVKRSSFEDYVKKSGNSVRWPKYGGLKVENTEKKLGIVFSSWKGIVDRIVRQGI